MCGTAKDVSKMDMIKATSSMFGVTYRDSNIADAISLAHLAYLLFNSFNDSNFKLLKQEAEIISSKALYNGKPKGLLYKVDEKIFFFDK